MNTNDAVVLALVIGSRALVPALLFRWPLWGGLACIMADGVDTIIQDALGSDIFAGRYHNIDKAFDIYYLGAEALVAYRWAEALARWTALVLFALRFAAVALFEVTGVRGLFFYLGPNVFELFFLWVAAGLTLDAGYRIGSVRRLALVLLLVAPPKLLQEYVMHYMDSQTWHFVKEHIFRWR